MKKRFFSLVLILVLLLALAAPCLAEEETPAFRLAKLTITSDGIVREITFSYDDGGWLPTQFQRGDDTITVEYDDAGRRVVYTEPTYTYQYVYNEAGQLAETTWQFDSSWQGNTAGHIVYTYDEAGNMIRQEEDTGDLQTVIDCVYDEHGNAITQTTSAPGGEPDVSTYSYEYNDQGLMISQTYDITQPWGRFTGTYTYEYDEQGRLTRESYDDGETRFYYMPLLSCEWSRMIWTDFDESGETGSQENISLNLYLKDAVGQQVTNWDCSMTGEPTLEYDDNGYLVRAFDADGNNIEITYEPVA